jgi:hypothetical protein
VLKKAKTKLAADEHGLKTKLLAVWESAFICVYQRPMAFFSILLEAKAMHPA